MNSLILVGGGGHCRSCIDVIEAEDRYTIRGVVQPVDGDSSTVIGYPIIGSDTDLPDLIDKDSQVLIAVGQIKTPAIRIRLFKILKSLNASLVKVVSPKAYFSAHARLGEGCIVMHGAVINAGATIAENCIINSQALVEHDTIIEAHCHVSTGALINGGVIIRKGCFIGSGSVLREGIEIGADSVIGAGQIVMNDVPEGTVLRHVS